MVSPRTRSIQRTIAWSSLKRAVAFGHQLQPTRSGPESASAAYRRPGQAARLLALAFASSSAAVS